VVWALGPKQTCRYRSIWPEGRFGSNFVESHVCHHRRTLFYRSESFSILVVLLIPEIIQKKRDGQELSAKEIRQFIEGVTSNEVTDAQIAAFSMAAYFQDFTTS